MKARLGPPCRQIPTEGASVAVHLTRRDAGYAFSQAALSPWVRVYHEICGFGVSLTDTPGSFSATW